MPKLLKKSLTIRSKIINDNSGFTLTEMLIVIALIALIGTFVTSTVMGKFSKAKVDATKIQIRNLGPILDNFKRDCNFYPLTDQGLEALVKKPAGRECKNYDPEGYIQGNKVPKDAWDNTFIYTSDGNAYVIKSLGQDNKEGGENYDKDLISTDL